MRYVLIGCGVGLGALIGIIGGLFLILFVASFFNGRVGAPTDYTQSALLVHPPEPLQKEMLLKVVTYNVQALWVVGRNRPARMREIARVLTDLDPDIVGFQEVFVAKDRAVLIDALKYSRLKYHEYFRSATVGSGLLVMSAFPIQEHYFHRYSVSNPWYKVWEGDWWAGKGVCLARIALPDGGMIDFYNTHAQAGYGNPAYKDLRVIQMAELAAFINKTRTRTAPALLTGDMNCRPGAVDFETAVSGAGLTRAMTIDTSIDHIFSVDDPRYVFETIETVTIPTRIQKDGKSFQLSDHPGYLSQVRIKPRE